MNKICVLGAYYGPFKKYFNLWLKSAECNHKIDFKIFTDNKMVEEELPSNVEIINLTLPDLKQLIIQKSGIHNISLEHPYRCCDFKPLYGVIFQDYIKDYEYWGHCDFDMIFGDIYGFLEKINYPTYDKILNQGHLSFYKNTDEVNHNYEKEGAVYPYMKVFTTPQNFAFDENSGITSIYLKNHLPFFKERIFFDISDIYHRFKLSRFCSLTKKDINYRKQIFYWSKGKVFRCYYENGELKKEERMYIHFKKRPDFKIQFDINAIDNFLICPSGFIPFNGDVTKQDIKRYNSGSLIRETYEYSLFIFNKYKRAVMRRLKKFI